jgi:EAL and modified HD-GYP domain-containing signal transduction protein
MSIFVARQPIFNARDELYGYELLYRRDESRTMAEGADASTMSARVISNAFLGIGINELTGGVPGFVNFTRENLLSRTFELFNPDDVVIELLESVSCDDDTLRSCREMHAAGYRFALDDFVYDPTFEPLLELASIVKVDVLNRAESDIRMLLAQLTTFTGRLLAERVENAEVHKSCEAMGFDLFQGYFYARPETVAKEDLDAGQVAILRVLALLRNSDTSDGELGVALRGDPSLCFKLLRIVNSASMGGSGIESIQHALRMVGRTKLHRWLVLILAASFATQGGTSNELALCALARGQFLESLAVRSSLKPPPEPLFMTGMLSKMDALMRVPMSRVLELVDVSLDVRSALVHRTGVHAPSLMLAEAYEDGDWELVRPLAVRVGVGVDSVVALYIDALQWARDQLGTACA